MSDVFDQPISMSRSQRSTMVMERIGAPWPPTDGDCTKQDTKWWFPGHGATKEERVNTEKAIDICRQCPIRKECLTYAMDWEAFGIWGGFTEKQRDAIRKSSGKSSSITTRAQSRATKTVSMIVERKDYLWLKQEGLI